MPSLFRCRHRSRNLPFQTILVAIISSGIFAPAWADEPKPAKDKPAEKQPAEKPPAEKKPEPPKPNLAAQINTVYEKTKTAQTIEDFTKVIDECQRLTEVKDISAARVKYLRDLQSWGLNRRGQLRSEKAAPVFSNSKASDEAKKEAKQLDASALADFEAAIKLLPDNWRALHNRSVSYAMVGKVEEALADLNRVVQLNPGYANAWYNRGEIHYQRGKFDEAIADYNQAMQLNPSDPAIFASRGHALYRQRRFDAAAIDFTRALQFRPQDADLLASRADVYLDAGEWGNAARDFRAALTINRDLGRAYQGAAWLMSTCPDDAYRDPKRAVEAAKKAIELSGESDFRYLETLAAAHAIAGKFDDARAALKKAMKQAPESSQARLAKRMTLYEKNKTGLEIPEPEPQD